MEDFADEQTTHYWYPLRPQDLWPPFVHCMMTILDEMHDSRKYDSLLQVEFYEWIARVAFRYFDRRKERGLLQVVDVFRHD